MLMIQQMFVLFLLMLIGYIAYKKEVIDTASCKKISSIVVNIANPALILSGVIADTDAIYGKDLLITVIVSISMFAVLLVIAHFVPKLLKVNKEAGGSYKVMTVFSNIGFMGFPIISSVLGNNALLYATIFLIPYNILIYTYGIAALRNESKKEKISFGRILNIGTIFCFISIFIYITGIHLPEWSRKTITMLSNLTAPLSMMVIGASFATISIKSLFSDVRLLLFSNIKLLVIPIVGTLFIHMFITNQTLVKVCMFLLSMPVGSMTAMLAQEYEGNYELVAKGVALTTALSVITLPVVAYIFN